MSNMKNPNSDAPSPLTTGAAEFLKGKNLPFYLLAGLAFSWIFIFDGSSSSGTGYTNSVKTGFAMEPGFVQPSAISGAIFSGKPIRSFDGKRVFNKKWAKRVEKKTLTWERIVKKYYKKKKHQTISTKTCDKWNVVTTIFPPTQALLDAAALDGWCTVVVGDNKTPANFMSMEKALKSNDSVFFFDIREQRQWLKISGELGEFARALPYNHFARKNLGFLYAMLRGAKFIFDFDDDNYVNKGKNGEILKLIPNEQEVENVRFITVETKAFNHHPLMGASIDTSWPRGFPLEHIQDTKTHGTVKSSNNKVAMDKIGVIQYCADKNPDIDAVHRLTKPLPMVFTEEAKSSSILVPSNTLVPYNAQATIHTAPAFFATLLPITVQSRVTDIWRGYFALALFRDINLSLLLAPPRITQIRNVHSYIGDMKGESDLYFKSDKLTEFLHSWTSTLPTLPARMEKLWIDLYERGYLEADDVRLAQLWLGALVQIQYDFRLPDISEF